MEEWTRRRLRSMIGKQWKRGPSRYQELIKRRADGDAATKKGGSSAGPWHISRAPLLSQIFPKNHVRRIRSPSVPCLTMAQLTEPPDAKLHIRWCNRERPREPTYVNYAIETKRQDTAVRQWLRK
jgi:hypothetical protein